MAGRAGALRAADDASHKRFVRWDKAGVWKRIFAVLSVGYDGGIVMVDSSSVRVHQHGAPSEKGALWAALAAA